MEDCGHLWANILLWLIWITKMKLPWSIHALKVSCRFPRTAFWVRPLQIFSLYYMKLRDPNSQDYKQIRSMDNLKDDILQTLSEKILGFLWRVRIVIDCLLSEIPLCDNVYKQEQYTLHTTYTNVGHITSSSNKVKFCMWPQVVL